MNDSNRRLLPGEKLRILLDEIEIELNNPSRIPNCCEQLRNIKRESSRLLERSEELQKKFNELNGCCQQENRVSEISRGGPQLLREQETINTLNPSHLAGTTGDMEEPK